MRKHFKAVVLLMMLLTSFPPLSSGEGFYQFYGNNMDEAFKDTPYDGYHPLDSGWNAYFKDDIAFCVIGNNAENVLFRLEKVKGTYRIAWQSRDAVCQCMESNNSHSRPNIVIGKDKGDLLMTHWIDIGRHVYENFVFASVDGAWVFTAYYAHFAVQGASQHDVTRVTWADGRLLYDHFTQCAPTNYGYGLINGKLQFGYFTEDYGYGLMYNDTASYGWPMEIDDRTPSTSVPWPERITLDNFDIETFPREASMQALRDNANSECNRKLDIHTLETGFAAIRSSKPGTLVTLFGKPSFTR